MILFSIAISFAKRFANSESLSNSSFLFNNLVDKVVLFVAPKIIGGSEAPGPYGGSGIDSLSDAVELEDLVVRKLGEDLMVEGYVKRRESRDVYRTCRGIG